PSRKVKWPIGVDHHTGVAGRNSMRCAGPDGKPVYCHRVSLEHLQAAGGTIKLFTDADRPTRPAHGWRQWDDPVSGNRCGWQCLFMRRYQPTLGGEEADVW